MDALLKPTKLWSVRELTDRQFPIPKSPGVYAWYFREVPPLVPIENCLTIDGQTLLYVGISPKKPDANGVASAQDLRKRLRNHCTGNASGSTLRLTLGCLLAERLGIELQQIGSRLRFSPADEKRLSEWMQENAAVCWVEDPAPWVLEDQLIERISLPLNLSGNDHHPFQKKLSSIRAAARAKARTVSV